MAQRHGRFPLYLRPYRCLVALAALLIAASPAAGIRSAAAAQQPPLQLCGNAPCDGARYADGLRTDEAVDRGDWVFDTGIGTLTVPANIRRWGVWRVAERFGPTGSGGRVACNVSASLDRRDTAAFAAGVTDERLSRRPFGAGLRSTLGQMASRSVELASSDAGGWSEQWQVPVPAGHSTLCWVMEAWVEVAPQWNRLPSDDLLAFLRSSLSTEESQPEERELRTAAAQWRRMMEETVPTRRFLLASEQVRATTFQGGAIADARGRRSRPSPRSARQGEGPGQRGCLEADRRGMLIPCTGVDYFTHVLGEDEPPTRGTFIFEQFEKEDGSILDLSAIGGLSLPATMHSVGKWLLRGDMYNPNNSVEGAICENKKVYSTEVATSLSLGLSVSAEFSAAPFGMGASVSVGATVESAVSAASVNGIEVAVYYTPQLLPDQAAYCWVADLTVTATFDPADETPKSIAAALRENRRFILNQWSRGFSPELQQASLEVFAADFVLTHGKGSWSYNTAGRVTSLMTKNPDPDPADGN